MLIVHKEHQCAVLQNIIYEKIFIQQQACIAPGVDHKEPSTVCFISTTSVEKEKDKQDESKEKQNITVTTESYSSEQSRQIMKRTIEISPDNWHKLSTLETIKVRFYIDTEGVDLHFTSRDRKKMAGFYNEVIAFEKSLNQHVSL